MNGHGGGQMYEMGVVHGGGPQPRGGAAVGASSSLHLINVRYIKTDHSPKWYDIVLCKNPTARMVLKDVTLELNSGEVMAVLGSVGSGKTYLLNAVAQRSGAGVASGNILVNGLPATAKYFRNNGGYVTQGDALLPLLSVQQSLSYTADLCFGSRMSSRKKRERVQWVMVELDLIHVENESVKSLNLSERRRVSIGLQLLKDPLILLVDDPMTGLDSFSANSLVSLLSRFAKKYNRIVIFTDSRPRSDIFPLIDRVTYLCVGEVVYTGYTKNMLEYFHSIGHPCPEFENPLDYYLTLASVDRRTPARLIETSAKVEKLIDKFRQFGSNSHQQQSRDDGYHTVDPTQNRVPMMAWGTPNPILKVFTLTRRAFWHLCRDWLTLSLRLLQLPLYLAVFFLFIFRLKDDQSGVQTRLGAIFYTVAITTILSTLTTAFHFGKHRMIYLKESRSDKLYSGPAFIFSQLLYNFLPNVLGTFVASTGMSPDIVKWLMYAVALLVVYSFAEVQTMALMVFIENSFTAFEVSTFISIVSLVSGSGILRSLNALPNYIYYPSFASVYRYVCSVVASNEFENLNFTCKTGNRDLDVDVCRYTDGSMVLQEMWPEDEDRWVNFGAMFAIYGILCLLTILIYLLPIRKHHN